MQPAGVLEDEGFVRERLPSALEPPSAFPAPSDGIITGRTASHALPSIDDRSLSSHSSPSPAAHLALAFRTGVLPPVHHPERIAVGLAHFAGDDAKAREYWTRAAAAEPNGPSGEAAKRALAMLAVPLTVQTAQAATR